MDYDNEEVERLVDMGLLELDDTAYDDKYNVLGIPEEFGRWSIWPDEEDDGRGGTVVIWNVIQDLDDDPDGGGIWQHSFSPEDAYEWVAKNYRAPDGPGQPDAGRKEPEPECRCESLLRGHEPGCPFRKELPLVGAGKSAGIRRWASGWNSPELPGQVFSSRDKLERALKRGGACSRRFRP